MKAILSFVIFGATLGRTFPNQKRATPCLYHRDESPLEPLIKYQFAVELQPGYSLDEHFHFIGYNLSAKTEKFHFMERPQ